MPEPHLTMITVCLHYVGNDDVRQKAVSKMLRDIAQKVDDKHHFTTDDKWYDEDGYTIAQYHRTSPMDTILTGEISGLD